MTRFLSIASGKGGVGKTTVAMNLGTALSALGVEVLVVDGNLSTPNIGLYLGITKFPVTLHDAVKGTKHISEAVYVHSSGLKIIPSSISVDDMRNIDLDNLSKVILDLYGNADIVLIDVSAGIGKEAVSAVKASEEMIIVATPDSASIADGIKMFNAAKEAGVKTRGVIINRWHDNSDFTIEGMRALLGLPIMSVIPEEPLIQTSVSMKQPVVFSHPECPASIAFRKLAAELIGQKYEEKIERPSLLARIFAK